MCLDTLESLGLPPSTVCALTMPGPGTTEHTLSSARELARTTGVELREIPIEAAVEQHLADIAHPGDADVTFENVQARERTQILFDTAQPHRRHRRRHRRPVGARLGVVHVHRGPDGELHVNAGVPKTLIAYLVRWYARHRADKALRAILERVLDTPITPELVPSEDGEIAQRTEEIIGPYELHDFFLFHFLRSGAGAQKIFALATRAFAVDYPPAEIKHWLGVFFRRFSRSSSNAPPCHRGRSRHRQPVSPGRLADARRSECRGATGRDRQHSNRRVTPMQRLLVLLHMVAAAPFANAQDVPYCGDEGVWLQILGSGGTDLDDQRGGASYLVWIDENVRLMVDVGSAAALRFDQAGAAFADLDAVLFTKLQARSLVDFPSLIEGSRTAFRERTLPVYGPTVPGGDSCRR